MGKAQPFSVSRWRTSAGLVFIRRLQDTIELSWGDRPIAGTPGHFRFNAYHGLARLQPDDVVWVLYDVLDNASRHLHGEMSSSPVLQYLLDDVKSLSASDHRRRLGLLSGVSGHNGDSIAGWDRIASLFPHDLDKEAKEAIFGADKSSFVVMGASQAALMFGSVSPVIDEADSRLLAAKLVEYYAPAGEIATLKNLVHSELIEWGDEEAWEYGYRLADELREALGESFFGEGYADLEAMYEHLSIAVDEIELHDKSIRAVAVERGPGLRRKAGQAGQSVRVMRLDRQLAFTTWA